MTPARKQKKKKIIRPQHRKLMIRDLPVAVAPFLHPSLRGILMNRPKRWNNGSPPHRIAVNLVRRAKRQLKPRVKPFFCEKCRLSSSNLGFIRYHECDKEDVKRAERKEHSRKFSDYNFNAEAKMAANPEKSWRYGGMAVLEQSLNPSKVYQLFEDRVTLVKIPTETEEIDSEPDAEFYEAKEQEFEDETPHYPLHEVLIPSFDTRPEPEKKPKDCHVHVTSGVFCYNCKLSFESYNQFQLHAKDDFIGGKCAGTIPEYCYIQTGDSTGLFDMHHKHSIMRQEKNRRDISHVQCTLCKAVNFASTGELYQHMFQCANAASSANSSAGIIRGSTFNRGHSESDSQ